MLDYISKIEQKILRRKLFDEKLNQFLRFLQKNIKIWSKIKPVFVKCAKIINYIIKIQTSIWHYQNNAMFYKSCFEKFVGQKKEPIE